MQFSVGPRLRARVSPTGHFLELLPPAVPFLPAAEGDAPCPQARVTFGRSPKSDQKRCLKPQVSRLPTRLGYAENRSCRKSKNRWFLAAFLHPFAAEGKRMSRRSAKYSRRRQTCRTRVQPAIEERKTGRRDASPCGVRDRSREKRPAPGERNTFFTSYHKSTKDCNARSAFPAAGHCI